MSTDKELLQETHDAVLEITAKMEVWCPHTDGRIESLETTVDGNGREGLKATVGWHRKLFVGMWAIVLAVIGLMAKALDGYIH